MEMEQKVDILIQRVSLRTSELIPLKEIFVQPDSQSSAFNSFGIPLSCTCYIN